MIERRLFLAQIAGATLLSGMPARARERAVFGGSKLSAAIARIEGRSGGRLGVGVIDTATGTRFGWRGHERFAMCSTFKFLVAAATLHRVDQRLERIDRRLAIRKADILPNSPVTEELVGKGATVAQLCQATLQQSDNTAANLLLVPLGGPAGLTRFVRSRGDAVTRNDRTEPAMNDVRGKDVRDTTTPLAMTANLNGILLGNTLRAESRARLLAWMVGNKTGDGRIRAGVPSNWEVADKTGTSQHGNYNDIALIRPPGRKPLLLSLYLAETRLDWDAAEAILAEATRSVCAAV